MAEVPVSHEDIQPREGPELSPTQASDRFLDNMFAKGLHLMGNIEIGALGLIAMHDTYTQNFSNSAQVEKYLAIGAGFKALGFAVESRPAKYLGKKIFGTGGADEE